jgi:hypothetical protein
MTDGGGDVEDGDEQEIHATIENICTEETKKS